MQTQTIKYSNETYVRNNQQIAGTELNSKHSYLVHKGQTSF